MKILKNVLVLITAFLPMRNMIYCEKRQKHLFLLKQLWNIEKTFRISKSDLRIRPIYHQLRRRIKSHICIASVACKIYKELERQLKIKKLSALSAEKVIGILKTIYRLTITIPYSNTKHSGLLIKNEEQKLVIDLFDLKI